MGILDTVQKLEKRLGKLARRSDVPLQPIEVRKIALDEIEDLVEPAGRSRRVFPYNRITVEVVATDAQHRAAMEAVLGEGSDLGTAVSDRLKSAGCPQPRGLEVRLKLVRRAGAEWETGRVFRVQCERVEAEATAAAAARRAPSAAQLLVIKGETTRKCYALGGERTNIGRLAEVVDKDQRVVRRNQIVFTEREVGVNLTVSRAHAHIAATLAGEYRLFDDHSSYGTRVLRAGRTLALSAGSPRGTKLQPDDEIYFGQACVRFEMKASSTGKTPP
jgi:hypothetical protein